MNLKVKFAVFLSLCVVIILAGVSVGAGTGAENPRRPFFPDPLLVKLGIDAKDIINNREKFRKDPVHTEWMHHVQAALSHIEPEKKESIIQTHASLLFIKDRLDSAYLSGRMDQQELTARIGELMRWFQEANRAVLSEKEYNVLFGISDQDGESAMDRMPDGELGFPVYNPETTVEMIKARFDDGTIADITRFYRQQSQELRDIRETYETKDFGGATQWEVRKDMARIENELNAAFKDHCRGKLTDEEFQLLFGNQQK